MSTSEPSVPSPHNFEWLGEDRPWVVILANPFSGSGPTQSRVEALVQALGRVGMAPRVIWDRIERGELLKRPELPARCRSVVAVGGDGTVADVVNEMPAGVSFATLPCGNENLFARELGFVADGVVLADAIAAGRTRKLDLGRMGSRLFTLMVSAGFDADVAHRLARWRAESGGLKRVRRINYAKPIWRSLRNYPYPAIELDADGTRVRGTHALVFNLPPYGMHLRFAPDAVGDDGLLDWVVFERPGFWRLIGYVSSVVRGTHRRRSDVFHGRARRVRIMSDAEVPVQVDGDPAGTTPIEIEAVPQALTVIEVRGETEVKDDG